MKSFPLGKRNHNREIRRECLVSVQRVIGGFILSLSLIFGGASAYGLDFDREIEAQNELSTDLVSSLQKGPESRDAKSNENDALQIKLVAKTRTAAFDYEQSTQD